MKLAAKDVWSKSSLGYDFLLVGSLLTSHTEVEESWVYSALGSFEGNMFK